MNVMSSSRGEPHGGLTAPGLAWSAEEKERAKAWLRELEEVHFPDAPDDVEPLSHLGRGLRLVREHRAVLES